MAHGVRRTWVLILPQPLIAWETLGKSLRFSFLLSKLRTIAPSKGTCKYNLSLLMESLQYLAQGLVQFKRSK